MLFPKIIIYYFWLCVHRSLLLALQRPSSVWGVSRPLAILSLTTAFDVTQFMESATFA